MKTDLEEYKMYVIACICSAPFAAHAISPVTACKKLYFYPCLLITWKTR